MSPETEPIIFMTKIPVLFPRSSEVIDQTSLRGELAPRVTSKDLAPRDVKLPIETQLPLIFPDGPWLPFCPAGPSMPWGPCSPAGPVVPFAPTDPLSPTSPFSPVRPVGPRGPGMIKAVDTAIQATIKAISPNFILILTPLYHCPENQIPNHYPCYETEETKDTPSNSVPFLEHIKIHDLVFGWFCFKEQFPWSRYLV